MPWTDKDAKEKNGKLDDKQAKAWAKIANSVLQQCAAEKGADCEGRAIKTANAMVKNVSESADLEDVLLADLAEAITIKAQAQKLMNDLDALLADKATPDSVRKASETLHAALKKSWSDLADETQNGPEPRKFPVKEVDVQEAAVTKTVAGEQLPASCFLVVEDSKSPSTWHLQVKDADGTPNHGLMGGAFAALTKGYRGNVYEGPNKAQAMADLKALYKAEEMEMPATENEEPKPVELEEGALDHLSECATGVEILSEGIAQADNNAGPLTMRVKLIEPGFGKGKGNHYYPANVLKRDAHVFDGVKMYETDHNPNEKSTRTWVSTIRKVTDFTSTGAPIAEVVVHDPNFAQRVRNLNTADLLEKLPCSIYTDGKSNPGKVEGRDVNVVEAIIATPTTTVDWVTVPGAGGKALSLAESAQADNKTEEKVMLEATKVLTALIESGLPVASQKRLAGQSYETIEKLTEAITAEAAYVKEVTPPVKTDDAGKPFGMGGKAPEQKIQESDTKPLAERELDVLKKYGLGR